MYVSDLELLQTEPLFFHFSPGFLLLLLPPKFLLIKDMRGRTRLRLGDMVLRAVNKTSLKETKTPGQPSVTITSGLMCMPLSPWQPGVVFVGPLAHPRRPFVNHLKAADGSESTV